VTFNMVRLREAIEYGIRIDEFAVEVGRMDAGEPSAQHSCMGPRRLIRLDTPATGAKSAPAHHQGGRSPVLSEFGLYLLPYLVEEPSIDRTRRAW